MKCLLCNREIPFPRSIGPHRVHQPTKDGSTIEMEICGQCYLLVNILDTLKEIKDGFTRRPKQYTDN